MISAITSAIEQLLVWIGMFLTSLLSESGSLAPLLPVFAIGIAVSVVLLGRKILSTFTWGA